MKWLKCQIFILITFTFLIRSFALANDLVFLPANDSTTVLSDTSAVHNIKHKRLKAILFSLLLGPLGGHRIYLNTQPKIPVIYSVTLGGFGIVSTVDLGLILFKKDLSPFENNNKFIMWNNRP